MSNVQPKSEVVEDRATKSKSYPIANIALWAIIFACGAAADLGTKQWIFAWKGLPGEQEPWWLWEGYIGIETAVNEGALFGLGAGMGTVFALLSIAAQIAILVWLFVFKGIESRWLSIASACVMAGIVGNLYDRLGMWWQPGMPTQWKSAVRDWILFRYHQYTWPNFNIADSFLVCGAIMLFVYSAFSPAPEAEPKTKLKEKAA